MPKQQQKQKGLIMNNKDVNKLPQLKQEQKIKYEKNFLSLLNAIKKQIAQNDNVLEFSKSFYGINKLINDAEQKTNISMTINIDYEKDKFEIRETKNSVLIKDILIAKVELKYDDFTETKEYQFDAICFDQSNEEINKSYAIGRIRFLQILLNLEIDLGTFNQPKKIINFETNKQILSTNNETKKAFNTKGKPVKTTDGVHLSADEYAIALTANNNGSNSKMPWQMTYKEIETLIVLDKISEDK